VCHVAQSEKELLGSEILDLKREQRVKRGRRFSE
jgi:hypothetical protein